MDNTNILKELLKTAYLDLDDLLKDFDNYFEDYDWIPMDEHDNDFHLLKEKIDAMDYTKEELFLFFDKINIDKCERKDPALLVFLARKQIKK